MTEIESKCRNGGSISTLRFFTVETFPPAGGCHVKFRTANIVGASAVRETRAHVLVVHVTETRARTLVHGRQSVSSNHLDATSRTQHAFVVCGIQWNLLCFQASVLCKHHGGLNSCVTCKQPSRRQPEAGQSPQTEWSKRRQQRLNSCITCIACKQPSRRQPAAEQSR